MGVSDRLNEIATFYNDEAQRCAKSRSYLAAAVMQVSALEAALQAMCFLYPREMKRTLVFQRKKFKGRRCKALEFTLYELICIADELGWFPPRTINWGKRSNLAGFAHEIRKLRNFVHPGVWARERSPTVFSQATNDVIVEVFEVATSWLLHKVELGLHRRMRKEGLV
jgi:hypothetical protein